MVSVKAEDQFQKRLDECRDVVRNSSMFGELRQVLVEYADTIDKIRCLALGSFHEDLPARYQLALLLEIENVVKCDNVKKVAVSLFDPAFTIEDMNFIQKRGSSWTVEESLNEDFKCADTKQVLYFLPHAPLDLTELVLIREKPSLFLANNIVAHTDRYTKARLHEKYPVLGKLLHVLDAKKQVSVTEDDDQFKTFISKKKKRKNKYVFREPVIDYDSVESYFDRCSMITTFQGGSLLKEKPWINSFSDLTFHLIE